MKNTPGWLVAFAVAWVVGSSSAYAQPADPAGEAEAGEVVDNDADDVGEEVSDDAAPDPEPPEPPEPASPVVEEPPVEEPPEIDEPPPSEAPPDEDDAALEESTETNVEVEEKVQASDEEAVEMDPLAVARAFTFNPPDSSVRVKPVAEVGALFVLWHRYQGGSDGTNFNLRRDGGQATTFFSWRLSTELELFRQHQIIFLYQPIDLRTRATLTGDFRVNGLTFPAGTPMQFRYGFDYYRLSYLYDFLPELDQEISLGLSLQLRVANLEFTSLDGTLQRTSQNLGPVPLIKLRGRYTFDNDVFIGTEIDGIGIRFPSDQGSVLGLFFDTSLRAGYSPTGFFETFLNLRYVGGGAKGPGSEPLDPQFGDGFNNNFIHAFNLSVGLGVK